MTFPHAHPGLLTLLNGQEAGAPPAFTASAWDQLVDVAEGH